jgi:hypothetical protein
MFDQFSEVSVELMRGAALALGQPETYAITASPKLHFCAIQRLV